MRIVLDTNVLVSGLLNPRGAPGRILDLVLAGDDALVVDDRIVDEYADVLSRAEFGFDPNEVKALLLFVEAGASHVQAESLQVELPDPDDLPFLEVAVTGAADALVSGNLRHFPKAAIGETTVLSPSSYLAHRRKTLGNL